MLDYSEILKQAWPEWIPEKQIGQGAYGRVFQVRHEELSAVSRAAVKIIPVPLDASEIESLRLEGISEGDIRLYYRDVVNGFISEIRVLIAVKGAPHIVSIEDFRVIENPETLHWDILIRMELLEPFVSHTARNPLPEAEVVRLGIELCTALDICHKMGVIHRDIKPQNIFIDRFGSFKLGDFGIARKMEGMTTGMSHKGTMGYIAPEVSHGLRYDTRADIYSLGLVMYQQLNEGRFPFLDTPEQAKNPRLRTEATQRRLAGEPLRPPVSASPELSAIVLKACGYHPEERFGSAAEMRTALQRLQRSMNPESAPVIPVIPSGAGQDVSEAPSPASEDTEHTVSARPGAPGPAFTDSPDSGPRQTDGKDGSDQETVSRFAVTVPASGRDIGQDAGRQEAPQNKPDCVGKAERKAAGRKKIIPIASAAVLVVGALILIPVLGRGGAKGSDAAGQSGRIEQPASSGDETAPSVHKVTIQSAGQGTVTASPESAREGDTVTLTAEAEAGYRFVSWETNGIELTGRNDEAENSFVVGADDPDLRAVFEPILYRVTAGDDGHGTAAADQVSGIIGDTVTLTARPDDGYAFKEWQKVSGDGSLSGDQLTIGTSDTEVRAVFEAVTYKVTVTGGVHGTAAADRASGIIGDTVTLTARPDDGYAFKEWQRVSGNGEISGNTLKIGTSDTEVRAVFEAVTYKVTVTGDGHGTVAVKPASGTMGDKVTLSAAPAKGYRLKEWQKVSGDGSLSGDQLTIGTSDTAVKAVFEAVTYKVTATGNGHGTVTVKPSSGIMGDKVTLSAAAAKGYRLKEWQKVSGDGTLSGSILTIGASDTEVKAVFEAVTYKVTATGDGHGTVTVKPSSGIMGDKVALSAAPAKGYRFKEWQKVSGDGTISGSTLTIGTSDTAVKAVFEAVTYKIAVSANDPAYGSVTSSASSGTIGNKVSLSAEAAYGYQFKKWNVKAGGVALDKGDASAANSFSVGDADVTIQAVFEKKISSVTVQSAEHGSGWADVRTAARGVYVHLDAAPDAGYILTGWNVISGGVQVNLVNGRYTFEMGAQDVVVQPVFQTGILDSGLCGKNVTWTLYGDGLLEIAGSGPMWDFDFSERYSVSGEGMRTPWYPYKDQITKLELKSGITTIGRCLFDEYTNLTGDLIIPETVTRVGDYAFSGCSNMCGRLKLSNNIIYIGMYSFFECGFRGELVLPEKIENIQYCAFNGCNGFTGTLYIPGSLNSFYTNGLSDMKGITRIETDPNGGWLSTYNGVLYTSTFEDLFLCPTGIKEFPALHPNTKTIGASAFSSCDCVAGDFAVPEGITTIGEWAFSDCAAMTSVTIPESVTYIDRGAFADSESMEYALFKGKAPEISEENMVFRVWHKRFKVYCYEENLQSFKSSSGYDANTNTWYGYTLAVFGQ